MRLDFDELMLGRLLGEGRFRQTYILRFDRSLVVKTLKAVDTDEMHNHNWSEWEMWCDMRHFPDCKWLAPCVFISPNGSILIQKRAQKIDASQIPDKIPDWVSDPHPGNWGLYEGRPVLVDYGYNGIVRAAVKRTRLVANLKERQYTWDNAKDVVGTPLYDGPPGPPPSKPPAKERRPRKQPVGFDIVPRRQLVDAIAAQEVPSDEDDTTS